MNARNLILWFVGATLLPACLFSCGEDRWAAYAEQTASQRWINDTMRVWYYWYEEIPEDNQLNYFQAPFTFFAKMLSKSDKFSVIDSLSTPTTTTRSIPYTDYSYGFQFNIYQLTQGSDSLFAQVLYVAADSPAAEIGLQRGDWILAMDNEPITKNNYKTLYGAPSMELTLGHYDAEQGLMIPLEQTYRIPAARTVNDNPVYYSSVYTSNEKRIGYLVYNHFSAGAAENGTEYNDALRDAFRNFASRQVNEFVLDLRYNNGGLLSCAQLLCSMLAPASALGNPLATVEYNNRFNPRQATISFSQDVIGNGANLNLSRLYVLTGSQTASASEMLINCLRPYMEVVTVGSTTVGKNVGSITFKNEAQMLTMSPIVCKIYNAEGSSDYENGFKADYSVTEQSDLRYFLPFGDPNEMMLSTALGLILNPSVEEESDEESTTRTLSGRQLIETSIEHRASGAVQMR